MLFQFSYCKMRRRKSQKLFKPKMIIKTIILSKSRLREEEEARNKTEIDSIQFDRYDSFSCLRTRTRKVFAIDLKISIGKMIYDFAGNQNQTLIIFISVFTHREKEIIVYIAIIVICVSCNIENLWLRVLFIT